MSELSEILNLINPDPSVLKKGRERQAAVWKGIEPDYLPLILSDSEVPELAVFSHYTLKEQFFDKEKMLAEQLKGLVGIAKANSDAQLSVRANLGVGVVATVFGLKPVFPQEDQMPWFLENPPKEMIAYRVSQMPKPKGSYQPRLNILNISEGGCRKILSFTVMTRRGRLTLLI